LWLSGGASAATSFSNSLTGFTGDSTVPATQTALNTAGFNFFSIEGLDPEFTKDPTVVFGATGAKFGSLFGGDGGRNYMRTNDSDYATVSYVAEISVTYGVDAVYTNQQAFVGMGSGDTALFGVADWSTQFASTWVQPEDSGSNPLFTTFRTNNDANQFVNHPAPGHGDGTHRIQMTFDATARTMVYAIDFNYAGGAFTADITAPTVDLNHVDCPSGCGSGDPLSADFFGPDGWPNEPSRIYFGGDDSVTFTDFSVVVSDEPGQDGDFDEDGDVDGHDFLVWQRGSSPDPLSAGDLTLWQSNYGVGGLAAVSSVPEPASVLLLVSCAFAATIRKRRV
jgi:hypothetical protein